MPELPLDAERPEQDAVAVAVVDDPGEVVERVGVAERAARVRARPLRDRRVAADDPDLAVRGRGEDVARAGHDRAGEDAPAHPLAPLPVAARVDEVVRRVGLERRRHGVHVEPRADDAATSEALGELRHVEELRDARPKDDLVADLRHVARRSAIVKLPMKTKIPSEVVGSPSARRLGVLEEEPVLRGTGGRACERPLRDDAADVVQRARRAVAGRRGEPASGASARRRGRSPRPGPRRPAAPSVTLTVVVQLPVCGRRRRSPP